MESAEVGSGIGVGTAVGSGVAAAADSQHKDAVRTVVDCVDVVGAGLVGREGHLRARCRQEVSSQPQSVSPLPFSTVAVSVVLWPAVSVPVPLMLIVVASASTVTISCAVEKVPLISCLP